MSDQIKEFKIDQRSLAAGVYARRAAKESTQRIIKDVLDRADDPVYMEHDVEYTLASWLATHLIKFTEDYIAQLEMRNEQMFNNYLDTLIDKVMIESNG